MADRVKLYTSFSPRPKRLLGKSEAGPSYIAECIASWRRAGFDVVSLNNAREINELSGFKYDVDYQQVAVDRPRIADFLRAIRASGKPVAGIINSDVFLAPHPEWPGFIASLGANGMMMVERINIDPASLLPTGRSCYGFDAFVFSTDLLSQIDVSWEFLFGEPWWDYWFPLAYVAAGGKLMTINAPVLFHLDHTQNWNQAQWIANARKTIGYFQRFSGQLPEDIVARVRRLSKLADISESELGPFAHWCFARLRRMAEAVRIPEPSDDVSLLPSLVGYFNDAGTRNLIADLNEVHSQIAVLKSAEVKSNPQVESNPQVNSNPRVNSNPQGNVYGETPLLSFWPDGAASLADGNVQPVDVKLYDQIQHVSRILYGRNAGNDADALQAVTAGALILNSRKATLRHFLALNAAWLRWKYLAAVDFLARRLGSKPQRTESGDRLLKLAREQGEKYLDAVDYIVNEAADAGGMKQVGDYIVAFAQRKAEGTYDLAGGKLTWIEPDTACCRIEIAVLDAVDKRFIPELKVRAKLTDETGRIVADVEVPFVWDPVFFHYGSDVSVPKGGRHDFHVSIEAPTFARHDRRSGQRYARGVEVTFERVHIDPA